MSIPNCVHIVADLAQRYPQEWKKAHNPSGGGPETEAFIRRLAYVLHTTVDKRFGLNGKRGNPNDLSDDALNWRGEGPGNDPTNGNQPVTVIDVINGAGGPNPQPAWQVFDQLPGPGAWVQPQPVGGSPEDPPEEPTEPIDLTPVLMKIAEVGAKVEALGTILAQLAPALDAAKFESFNAASRASEIKTLVEGLPKEFPKRKYGGTLSLPKFLGGERRIELNPED